MRFIIASVCAVALAVGAHCPASAATVDAQSAANSSAQSGFEVASNGTGSSDSGSYEIANSVTTAKSVTTAHGLSGRVAPVTSPTFGADFSMWNTKTPVVAAASAAKAVTHQVVAATTPVIAPAIVAAAPGVATSATPALNNFASGLIERTRDLASRITQSAMHFIGTPYVFGGTSTYGFDCSGYVQHVFAMFGISLPRTADAQYLVGQHVAQREMVVGDLVFFQTYTAGVSHVGIYLGNGTFIHSSGRGVQVSSLHEDYWASRYVGATHIIGSNVVATHLLN